MLAQRCKTQQQNQKHNKQSEKLPQKGKHFTKYNVEKNPMKQKMLTLRIYITCKNISENSKTHL